MRLLAAALMCVLVNALYMKGEWMKKFDKGNTMSGTFYVSQNEKKKVEYLNALKVRHGYYEDAQCQVLSLDYKDSRYSFNIFLPKEWRAFESYKYGLESFQKEMNGAKIQEILNSGLHRSKLNIKIPKFKLESQMSLADMLKSLGIHKMFGGGDLSGFTGSSDLSVSKVIHKATIEMDEEGTVASAVTMASIERGISMETAFRADHPFFNNS